MINASAHGAIPNDATDDSEALKVTITAACARSAARYADYLNRTAADPSLPRLPNGPDDRPVLVEVRFDPGRYDMVNGPFSYNGLSGCAHLLLNGQNATIVAHPPPGWAFISIDKVGWLLGCVGCTHVAVYDFVFDTAESATTMGTVIRLITNATGSTVGVRVEAAQHHAVWNDNFTTVQPVLADGAFDLYGKPGASYAGWPGASTVVCGPKCMDVTFLPPGAPNPVGQGGYADTANLAVGQLLGFVRGCVPPPSFVKLLVLRSLVYFRSTRVLCDIRSSALSALVSVPTQLLGVVRNWSHVPSNAHARLCKCPRTRSQMRTLVCAMLATQDTLLG